MPWPPPRLTHCPRCGQTGVPPPWTSSSNCRQSRAACPVARPRSLESTALGAATVAGLAEGVWSSVGELAALWEPADTFEPELPFELVDALYAGWRRVVEKSMGWAPTEPA